MISVRSRVNDAILSSIIISIVMPFCLVHLRARELQNQRIERFAATRPRDLQRLHDSLQFVSISILRQNLVGVM